MLACSPSGATWATSTSDLIIAGSLPPSSRVTRFTSFAEAAMIALPVLTDPVKETLRMDGELTRWTPTLWPSLSSPETKLNTPFGKTSASSSATRWPVSGVYGDGLWTTVLPHVMDGAHFCTAVNIGKFHGVMHATGPIGLRTAIVLKSSSSE